MFICHWSACYVLKTLKKLPSGVELIVKTEMKDKFISNFFIFYQNLSSDENNNTRCPTLIKCL